MPKSDPLRLCLVIPTLDRGGAEKQLCLLAAGLDRRRFDPYVLTLTRNGPLEAFLRSAGVPILSIGKRWKIDPFAYRRLQKAISDLRPDIVHTWLFAANAYGRMAAIRARVPVVVGGERSVDPWKRHYEYWIDRWLAKRSQAILTNSNGVKEFYVQHGIDADKLVVIPNGQPERSAPEISKREFLQRLGLPEGRTYIAAVGRLWPQKGYKEMIWAVELLRLVRPDVLLVIIGDGPHRPRLEQFRDQVQVAHHVRFVGERSDVAELLPHFDLFLNTSQYEGQSNAIMEAMQALVPVVATDIPGNRDLIIDGETGMLVPVGAADQTSKRLFELLEEPSTGKVLALAAAERIRREFSVAKMIAQHEATYQNLLRCLPSRG